MLSIPRGIEILKKKKTTEIVDQISRCLFLFTEYHNFKSKFSNNRPRYQPAPAVGISDTSQRRLVNQANTNNITHAPVDHIYSTSTIAEGVF